jgi:Ni,Fe-hydrogenase maturation factor
MKTAVEWFALELYEKFEMRGDGKVFDELYNKAKEMEKQQIIDAINFGDERGKITTYSTAEQYYNETFKT